MNDDSIKKVQAILKEATELSPKNAKKCTPTRTKIVRTKSIGNVSIVGDGNIHVGGDININIKEEKRQKPAKPEVKPGIEHITEEQASVIQGLVKEIAELEVAVKKSPKSFGSIWGGLNSHMKVSGYRMILLDDYDKATKYLRMWKGRLNATPSAKKKNKDWRNTRLSAIHATAKNFELEYQMRAYIMNKFKATSLTELTDEELDATYRYMLSAKKEAQKKNKTSLV